MASIIHDPNGRKRIQLIAGNGKKCTLRLGKCAERAAETVRLRIEELQSAKLNSHPLSRETTLWLAGISDMLHGRLARAGLIQERAGKHSTTLGDFLDAYIASRIDAKAFTIVNFRQAQNAMLGHFGAQTHLADITPGDADAFRLALLGKGLAENTIRRFCGRARQFFHAAIRQELVHRNPFAGMKCNLGANRARMYFVTLEETQKVLDACSDAQWRLLFALSRFAGLRCPSEHLALTWEDVDWEHNRMTVHSPKTEHHEGKDCRIVPIFPELLAYLRDAYEQAQPGTVHVITRYRDSNCNLRTQLQRIMKRARVKPWPKLFQNLRATRETELAERFPLHVVCSWIGNSSQIATKHYLQITDDHFARAVNPHPTLSRELTVAGKLSGIEGGEGGKGGKGGKGGDAALDGLQGRSFGKRR